MWKLKTLHLLNGIAPQGNLLRGAEIARQKEAVSIVELAQQQAQTILEEARECAQAEKEAQQREWEAVFWQQAQTLLAGWQAQRDADEAHLVERASQLLNDALQQLLDEVDDARRFHALLKQLLRNYPRQQQATLYCASEQEQAVSGWLAGQAALSWTLCADPTLPPDRLRLVTGQGELLIDWRTLCQQLSPAPALESA